MTFFRRNSREPHAKGSSGFSRRPTRGTSSPPRQTVLVGGGPLDQFIPMMTIVSPDGTSFTMPVLNCGTGCGAGAAAMVLC